MDIEFRASGPLTDGTAARRAQSAGHDAAEAVAQEAKKRVKARLKTVLEHPSGFYESHIQISNQSDTLVVSDGNVVYGPWLEGTGSRNARSRFKGYATFRRVLGAIQRDVGSIAGPVVERKLRGL